MLPALVVAFVVVPLVELYVLMQVGREIGVVPTLALVVFVSVVGGWLVKREGLSVWRRARRTVDAGGIPSRELVDGVLILGAGALLLTPGFVTDLTGIALLLPPTRAAIRAAALRRMRKRAIVVRGPW